MNYCYFVSDIHGQVDRYEKLFKMILSEQPTLVFIGGDFLPSGLNYRKSVDFSHKDFINGFLAPNFEQLRDNLKDNYPKIYIIMGNDDGRMEEASVLNASTTGIWEYIHQRRMKFDKYPIYGYSFVPPTPFLCKDWERYDVSRYVDPGCLSLEDGYHSIPVSESELRYSTIKNDLDVLTADSDLSNTILLFHTPPYQTSLDRAALDGKMIDHVPLDVHVGSIAVKKFIEMRQPMITLHGHIHESTRLTGEWKIKIGNTYSFTAAHDGSE